MLGVNPADAAYPVGREELALAQEVRQDTRQHGVVHQRQQMLAALVLPVGTGTDVVALEGTTLVPAQTLPEPGYIGQKPLVDHLGGEQRDQADHRIDIDAAILAVGRDDQVLEEAGVGIPQRHPAVGVAADGVGDGEELLEGLDGDILVVLIFDRQFERHHRHVEREHRYPAGGIGLLQAVARRQRLRPVDDRDVVEAEKAAFEDVITVGILAVDPPGVIQQQLVKDPLQETAIAVAPLHALGPKGLERAEGMDRRVDIAEVPLVGRDLAVRMQVTITRASARSDPWRSRRRSVPRRRSETPDPRRRTRGTPSCRAWR